MRMIFMGTSEFAVPSLKGLIEAGHVVAGVWTRLDKPHGRGHRMDVSPIKRLALEASIPVYQPRTLRTPEAIEEVRIVNAEAICVAAYGLILPRAVLEMPRVGCINVHASLLPHYRGAAPIHRAIIAGEMVTGITTMMMDEGLDTGDMLLREDEPIGPDDTYGEVHDRLALRGARMLVETLEAIRKMECPRETQDPTGASYAPPVKKDECAIDWTRPAAAIHNLVRGTNPRPGAYTFRGSDLLRIHRTRVVMDGATGTPGEMLAGPGQRILLVGTGQGFIELLEVQPAGKRVMSGHDYLLGRPVRAGDYLANVPANVS